MAPWFDPDTPKTSARYKRPVYPSGRNRTIFLVFALALLFALFYAGCEGMPDILA